MLVTETGTVTLSKEFKEVTPPRTERQLENRKDFLLECGHIFPFLTCHGILADDYDDYAICKKCGIPFETAEMGTEIKDEVISRIVYKQLNIGHLTPFQRCEILLRNQKALKATADWRGYDFPADFAKIAEVIQKTLDLVKEMLSLDYKNEDLLNLVRDERVSISRAHDKLMEEAEMNGLKNDLKNLINTIESFYGVPSVVFPSLQKIAKKYR